MLAALVAVLAGAVRRFHPDWQPLPLIAVCFLVAIEAGFVHRAARVRHFTLGERLRYLVPEVFVLAAIMRLVATLSFPGADLAGAMRGWLFDPLSVLDPLFVLDVAAGLATGFLAHAAASDLATIEPRAAEPSDPQSEGFERYAAFLAIERTSALARLSSRFVGGGLVLLVALSIETANLGQIGGPPQALSDLSVAAALTYLVTGFLLFSRARLALLQSRWQLEGAHVAANVARRWSSGSLLLIGGVLLAAALLPRAYGMGLLDTLRWLLGMVGYAIAFVGYLVTWLFGLLLILPAWLLSLFMLSGGSGSPVSATPFAFPAAVASEPEPRLWPAIIFWLCIVALIIYATRIFLRRHPRLLRGMRAWLARTLRNLAQFWRGLRSWAVLASEVMREQLDRSAPANNARTQRRLARLDPRALVAHYYRAIVRTASSAGHPHHPGQTPTEYQSTLAAQRPELATDLTDLTEAYVRARYAPTPITPADARHARGLWERLRRMVQRRTT
jgi:hypothetical protein